MFFVHLQAAHIKPQTWTSLPAMSSRTLFKKLSKRCARENPRFKAPATRLNIWTANLLSNQLARKKKPQTKAFYGTDKIIFKCRSNQRWCQNDGPHPCEDEKSDLAPNAVASSTDQIRRQKTEKGVGTTDPLSYAIMG